MEPDRTGAASKGDWNASPVFEPDLEPRAIRTLAKIQILPNIEYVNTNEYATISGS